MLGLSGLLAGSARFMGNFSDLHRLNTLSSQIHAKDMSRASNIVSPFYK